MGTARIPGDLYVTGNIKSETLSIPDGTVDDDAIEAAAGIAATKLEHRHQIVYQQDDAADIVAATAPVYIVYGATGVLEAVQVSCVDAPSGGNEGFSVDVQKANEGTPTPATLLNSVVTYDDDEDDCEVIEGDIATSALAAGDMLIIVIDALGATGTKGQGLVVTLVITEDAE